MRSIPDSESESGSARRRLDSDADRKGRWYRVTVSNGKFTDLSSISFDIPYISAAGSWGSTSFPSYCNNTNYGVTANYLITKTVEIGIGDFSFEIKSETDNEIFALLTSLN